MDPEDNDDSGGQLKGVSITSFQHGLLESRFTWTFRTHPATLDAIHAGITVNLHFHILWRKRKIMTYSGVTWYLGIDSAIWNRQIRKPEKI
jgi:hypothetical protein